MSLLIATRKAILIPQPKIRTSQGIVPVLGGQILQNIGFESAGAGGADIWANWVEVAASGVLASEGTLVHGGTIAAKETQGAAVNVELYQSVTVDAKTFHELALWCRGDGTNSPTLTILNLSEGGSLGGADTQSAGVPGTTYTRVFRHFFTPNSTVSIRVYAKPGQVDGAVSYFDDFSLKPFTLSSILGAYLAGVATGTYRARPVVSVGAIGGFALNWDGLSDGNQDLVLAYVERYDTDKLRLWKCVEGTWTGLINAAITYVAGAEIELRHPPGTDTYRLFYNNVQIGADQTITDATVKGNTGFAGFKTLATDDLGALICF